MRYLAGIDNGGTYVKAAIFGEDGTQISCASAPAINCIPAPGHVERDMDTLWRTNAAVIKEAVISSGIDPKKIAGVSFSGHGKGLYLVGADGRPVYPGILSTDNRAWRYEEQWNQNGTADKVYEKTFQRIMACQPVSGDVIFLPYLNGAPEDVLARGSFIGLTSYHKKQHLMRAVYEGVAFSHLWHIRRLLRNRDTPGSIRLSGGAANSRAWVQMFADVLKLPVDVIEGRELGAQGAAMAAGVGAGLYRGYRDGMEQTVKIVTTVTPREEYKEIYEQKYSLYCEAARALSPVWKRYSEASRPKAGRALGPDNKRRIK